MHLQEATWTDADAVETDQALLPVGDPREGSGERDERLLDEASTALVDLLDAVAVR